MPLKIGLGVEPNEECVAFYRRFGNTRSAEAFLADPTSFDLIAIPGGEDISPQLYGHPNMSDSNDLRTDFLELQMLDVARENGIPITGMCRGIQLINVWLGGTLVQDFNPDHLGHHRHWISPADGSEDFTGICGHSQFIVPARGVKVLACARDTYPLGNLKYGGRTKELLQQMDGGSCKCPEAIAVPELKVFATQFHPELVVAGDYSAQWVVENLKRFCFPNNQ